MIRERSLGLRDFIHPLSMSFLVSQGLLGQFS